jgi:cation-transporting ATPase I
VDAKGEATAQALARDSLRVLAVASRRPASAEDPAELLQRPLEDLDLLGFVGLADTPAP